MLQISAAVFPTVKCDICGKSFSQNEYLKQHIRAHTAEKRFECVVCGKPFAQRQHLRFHIFTHTGEKPYECDVCG